MTRTTRAAIMYSHGGGSARTFEVTKPEELASHGFIVVTMDHADAFATILSDGSLIPGILERNATRSDHRDKDVQFMMTALSELNASDPLFGGRFDLDRIGVFGYSWGGYGHGRVQTR